jgi:NitT/TauT family transport system permease protein
LPEEITVPAIAFIIFALVCEVLVSGLHAGAGLLPAPSRVLPALVDVVPPYLQNVAVTLGEAGMGYLIGNGLALVVALLVIGWAPLRSLTYQFALILYSVPFIVIAPLLVVLFGNGYTPRVMIATLACFFPTLTSAIRGLLATPQSSRELFRLYGASGPERLWRMIVPYALPYIFIGLKFAVGAAFLGALVAEWAGADQGIGTLLLYEMFGGQTARVWATVFLIGGTTGLLFALGSLAERLLVPWSGRAHTT